MQKFDGNIPVIQTLTNEGLTQNLIPSRFIPEKPLALEGKMLNIFSTVQIHLI
jgi:hypothetical protein